jgi:hypothetical protein
MYVSMLVIQVKVGKVEMKRWISFFSKTFAFQKVEKSNLKFQQLFWSSGILSR